MTNTSFQSKFHQFILLNDDNLTLYSFLLYREDAAEIDAFLKPMLQLDPDTRCSATEALAHEWLSSVDSYPPIPLDSPRSDTEDEQNSEEQQNDGTDNEDEANVISTDKGEKSSE